MAENTKRKKKKQVKAIIKYIVWKVWGMRWIQDTKTESEKKALQRYNELKSDGIITFIEKETEQHIRTEGKKGYTIKIRREIFKGV